MRPLPKLLPVVLMFLPMLSAAQSKPNWQRDYIYGPGGQLTVTVEPDTYAPATINTLAGSFNSNTCTVSLSWTAPVDIGSGISLYKIYRNSVYYDQSTTPSYQDTGIQGNKTYTYTVTSTDKAGNVSSNSNSYHVLTPQSCNLSAPQTVPKIRLQDPIILASASDPPLLRRLRWLLRRGEFHMYQPLDGKSGGAL